MGSFGYSRPTTLHEALCLLREGGGGTRPFAGGTDLLVQLRHGMREADALVDLKRIPELCVLRYDSQEGLVLGAAVPCADVAEAPGVRRHYPILVDGAGIIGGSAIRQRATVGGNLCNASPSADTIPALLVLNAVAQIVGTDGWRQVPVRWFCTGPGLHVLAHDEILVALHIPPPAANSGARYLRFTPRGEMDIAVVGAGVWLRLDEDKACIADARIALSAVAPVPWLATEAAASLVGKPATEESFARAAELAQQSVQPIADVRGTLAQRMHLAGVMTRRALQGALERAQGESSYV